MRRVTRTNEVENAGVKGKKDSLPQVKSKIVYQLQSAVFVAA